MNRKQRRANKKKNSASQQNVMSAQEAALVEQAQTLIQNQDLAAATQILAGLIRENPRNAKAVELMGIACDGLQNYDAGIQMFLALKNELGVKDPKIDVYIAHMQIKKGDYDIGMPAMERALKAYKSSLGHAALGGAYNSTGNSEKAYKHLKKAVDLDPDNIQILYNFCIHHEKFENENNKYFQKLVSLSQDKDLPSEHSVLMHFCLYKAHEDLKEYDAAFGHLKKANALKREQLNYNSEDTGTYYKAVRTYFDSSFIEDHKEQAVTSDKPVFILGMPRSGTTLLEQILVAHPDIHGIEEDPFLSNLIRQHSFLDKRNNTAYPLAAGQPQIPFSLKDIGEKYIAYLNQKAPESKRVTNKAIANLVWFPVLKAIFPNGRFIHISRHAVDCCLSSYSKNFTSEPNVFTYDLNELGQYYAQYVHTMEHWDTIIPDGILNITYESLIEDFEGQTRAIIEYLGLEWSENCLKFYEFGKKAVKTASVSQVRKPIYKSAVKRWRHYDSHLIPLIEALGDAAPQDTSDFLKNFKK